MPKKPQEQDFEYFSFELSGHKPSKASMKHQYDAGGAADIFAHDGGLFDEDETQSGEQYDTSTGNRIDNSTYTGAEDLVELDVSARRDGSEDMLKPLKTRHDAAAEWLAEHDVRVEFIDEVAEQRDFGTAA